MISWYIIQTKYFGCIHKFTICIVVQCRHKRSGHLTVRDTFKPFCVSRRTWCEQKLTIITSVGYADLKISSTRNSTFLDAKWSSMNWKIIVLKELPKFKLIYNPMIIRIQIESNLIFCREIFKWKCASIYYEIIAPKYHTFNMEEILLCYKPILDWSFDSIYSSTSISLTHLI